MQNIVQQNNKPMWLICIIRNLTQYPLFHCNQKPEIDPSRIYKSHNSKIHQVQQNNKLTWLICIIRNLTSPPLFGCNRKLEIDPSRIYKSNKCKIHQVQQNNALMWLICLICNLNPSPLLLAIKNLRGATQKYQSVSDKVLHCNQI